LQGSGVLGTYEFSVFKALFEQRPDSAGWR
jgi:hypothetical protein